MSGAHRRFNPLLGDWVLCSAGRLSRPWQGEREESASPAPLYDPECYLCPGNARSGGAVNPEYEGVFAFDNDFPALADQAGEVPLHEPSPLLRAEPVRGRCRVLAFSPRHDEHLGGMSESSVRRVVDAWAEESERLGSDEAVRYVQIFENRGAMMGASSPHPHCQIWAVSRVPTLPSRKAERLRDYHERTGRDLLGDYLGEELRRRERLVETTERWVQLVPFWAVWPFETLLLPRRRVESLSELDDNERRELAGLLGRLTRRYDALFGVPFPYSMGWYERIRDGGPRPGQRLHGVYLPPLLRSASVRKFLVGYELTAEPQRDLSPEEAAERLRAKTP